MNCNSCGGVADSTVNIDLHIAVRCGTDRCSSAPIKTSAACAREDERGKWIGGGGGGRKGRKSITYTFRPRHRNEVFTLTWNSERCTRTVHSVCVICVMREAHAYVRTAVMHTAAGADVRTADISARTDVPAASDVDVAAADMNVGAAAGTDVSTSADVSATDVRAPADVRAAARAPADVNPGDVSAPADVRAAARAPADVNPGDVRAPADVRAAARAPADMNPGDVRAPANVRSAARAPADVNPGDVRASADVRAAARAPADVNPGDVCAPSNAQPATATDAKRHCEFPAE